MEMLRKRKRRESAGRRPARRGLAHGSCPHRISQLIVFVCFLDASGFPSVKSLSCDGVSHESPNAL
jgi:hypothetical protein